MKKVMILIFIIVISVNAYSAGVNFDKANALKNLQEVIRLVDTYDMMAAVEYMNSRGKAYETAMQYNRLVKDLYWKNRITELATIGRCGIQYCYLKASDTKDLKLKTDLMAFAKTISYNISANTWPAWGDKGILISPENSRMGLDCAKINLRLAKHLNKGSFAMGNARWLLGAHYLIGKDYTRAILSFMKARSEFKKTGKAEYILMAQGYLAITEFVKKPTREGGTNIMSVVVKLKALDTNDANFFASQLEIVLTYVTKKK